MMEIQMTSAVPAQSKPPSWQITVAAEGIAAAQFARCGFDVSVQYGPNKPKYDLVVAKANNLLTVSVVGSQDGVWDLTQSYLKRATELSGKKADYHGAIALWLDHHGSRAVCCLVQFQGVAIDQLPRIYLASPKEIAQRMRDTAKGRGDSTLYEECDLASFGDGTEAAGKIPSCWRFSQERIQELIASQEAVSIPKPILPKADLSFRAGLSSDRVPRERSAALAMGA